MLLQRFSDVKNIVRKQKAAVFSTEGGVPQCSSFLQVGNAQSSRWHCFRGQADQADAKGPSTLKSALIFFLFFDDLTL